MGLRLRLYRFFWLFFILGAAGCSNNADPDEPVVIGTPPDTAYLGVEYAYNFGAFGGATILDFALANAPPWLGLEDTANKARTGVILRGVPGITGGRRGEEDIGTYSRISINVTDGSRLGGNFFSVKVEHNVLSVVEADIQEGKAYQPAEAEAFLERMEEEDFDPADDPTCVPPPIKDVAGTYLATNVPVFDETSNSYTLENRKYTTYPVLVAVNLAHPSVEPVSVAFELNSAFACEAGATPADCEYLPGNRQDTNPDEDYILNSDSLPPPPDYLQYSGDNEGVLTFEPGKTTCFIRLEVIDDQLPELNEDLRLTLTEVREGLASLTEGDAERNGRIRIEDNEPTVSFEPASLIISEGASRTITAKLSKPNKTGAPIKVRVIRETESDSADEEASTADDNDFSFAENAMEAATIVSIPNGESEANFTVYARDDTLGLGDVAHIEDQELHADDVLVLVADEESQFGRENFARAGTARTEIVINEWTATLDVSAEIPDFIPTAITTGSFGDLYIAGVQTGVDAGSADLGDESGELASVYRINRLGAASSLAPILVNSGDTRMESPKLAFSEQTDSAGAADDVLIRQVAIGSTILSGSLLGEAGKGESDIAIGFYENKLAVDDDDVYQPTPDPDADPNAAADLWEAQLGSAGVDELVDIQVNRALGVVFGANTFGNWPLSERQSYRGRQDTVLGRVLTNPEEPAEGSSEEYSEYVFDWARMIGTSADDRLAASPISGSSAIFAAGETFGALEPDKTFGGSELFFVRTDTGDLNYILQQYGTPRNDTVSDAAYVGSSVWTAGSNQIPYAVGGGGVVISDTAPNATRNPYILIFSANEAALEAITLVDAEVVPPYEKKVEEEADEDGTDEEPTEEEEAPAETPPPQEGIDQSDENIYAIAADGDSAAVIGGDTNGDFVRDAVLAGTRSAILAKVFLREGKLWEVWRYQMEEVGDTRVVDVAVSKNGKAFALIETGDGAGYSVILLDDQGKRLDTATP